MSLSTPSLSLNEKPMQRVKTPKAVPPIAIERNKVCEWCLELCPAFIHRAILARQGDSFLTTISNNSRVCP
jgi:hypothetical protein